MKDNADIILEMKYFGPIIDANINIKPLTVFIGRNNVGKSYTTKLFYALCKAHHISYRYKHKSRFADRYAKDIRVYIKNSIVRQIERVFFTEANNLINRNSRTTSFSIKKGNIGYKLDINDNINIELSNITKLKELIFFNRVFLLPSSRSGLQQTYKITASNIIESVNIMRSIDLTKVMPLPGDIADFISLLLKLQLYSKGIYENKDIITKFEDAMKGKITLRDDIFYFHDNINSIDVELNRSSSGIQELAPVYLITKYLITKGSLLIIEEPETHLHPELIRSIARILALLVRRGVYVIITTHSDYLIEQLSLLIKLSNLDSSKRKKLGYGGEEYLKHDEVSAYLFKYLEDRKGSVAEELRIDKEEGIPSDEFAKVVNELRNEYVRAEINEGQ